MKKGLKIVINVALLLVVLGMGYVLLDSILAPIRFKNESAHRSNIVKDQMIRIRQAELAYLDTYGKYTADFDTLINFIEKDSLKITKSYGIVPDSIYLNAKNRKEAELKAIELGIITRDTIKVSVRDSLFKDYNPDTLPFIPYTDLTEKFQLNAGEITTVSKAVRPVFEIKVHNNSFTKGLDKQKVTNLNDAARDNEEFPGFVVGSMFEVTTAGSWD